MVVKTTTSHVDFKMTQLAGTNRFTSHREAPDCSFYVARHSWTSFHLKLKKYELKLCSLVFGIINVKEIIQLSPHEMK